VRLPRPWPAAVGRASIPPRHLPFLQTQRDMTQAFDTIIVGAGAAGCVLANRLSARAGHSVLLI